MYYIDGYNLLFHLLEGPCVETSRQELLAFLDHLISNTTLKATIIFDNHSPLATPKPSTEYHTSLKILFSPRGLCADAYILEILQGVDNPKLTTLVTKDVKLAKAARALGAATLSNEDFLHLLHRKAKKKTEKKDHTPSPKELARLQKIFEERYNR